jgi:long-chain acyl-CoA synthetase
VGVQGGDRRRLQAAGLREKGKPIPFGLAASFWLARLFVLNNVRKLIGAHRARVLVTGAAPISPDLVRWYMALGLDMGEVWGQTESCGAVTSNPRDRVKPGSIGTRMAPSEVKVSPDGELLIAARRCSWAISISRRKPRRR